MNKTSYFSEYKLIFSLSFVFKILQRIYFQILLLPLWRIARKGKVYLPYQLCILPNINPRKWVKVTSQNFVTN